MSNTTPCFEAFKASIYVCKYVHLIEGMDYTVGMGGLITFQGQYYKELVRDWGIWKDSWNAAARFYNSFK